MPLTFELGEAFQFDWSEEVLQPLQALHGPCMQGAILTRLELQLDVFAAADADEFNVERLRGGAPARRGC